MKHFTLLIAFLGLITWQGNSQILNQAASWPNAAWTLSGTYSAGALLSDPTSSTNFSYDDDAAGSGSTDILEATSPVIDLTTASGGGETWVNVDYDYDYNLGNTFNLEWYDADLLSWVVWEALPDNSGLTSGWCAAIAAPIVTSATLDISGFSAAQLSGFRYRFNYDASSTWGWGMCVSSPTIYSAMPPSCIDPSALSATAISGTGANLGWTDNAGAGLSNVEYGPTGFVLGTGTQILGTTNNPEIITGLTPLTTYQFYIQSDCGGSQSAWVGPFSFTTTCASIVPSWLDDVESHANSTSFTTSNCWGASATTSYDWNITGSGTTPSSGTGALTANSGIKYFYTEASGAAVGAVCTLSSPTLDASLMTVPQLSFWYHMTGTQIGSLAIEAWDGATWNQVDIINGEQQAAQSDAFLEKVVILNGYNIIDLQIRFVATSAGSFEGDICIDDISVVEAPTCPQPIALVLDSADLTTASISWTPTGSETEWAIEYGAPGFTPGTGTSVLVSPNPWYTISGLTSQSFFDVYVRAACAPADTSFYTGALGLNTYNQGAFMDYDNACGPGFFEISATGTAMNLNDDQSYDIPAMPFPFLYQGMPVTSITVSDNGALLFNSPGGTIPWSNQTIAAASTNGVYGFWDDIDPGVGNTYWETIGVAPNRQFIVQFDEKQQYYSNNPVEIITFQIVLDEATGEIFTIFEDSEFGGSSASYDNGASATQGVVGPNQDLQVSYNNATYLENNSCIRYYYTDCPSPVNYNVTYVTENEGAITWGSGLAGETNWTVIYGPAGFDPAMTGTVVQTATPALIMPGLDDITTYDVYIYADCSPILQSLGATGSFTTLPNCANPSGISTSTAVDTVMTNWAWTENVGYPSTGFGIQYGWSGFTPGNGTIAWVDNNYTDTTADASLMGGGVYQMYVQAVCGTDSSSWVGPVTFTMPLTNDSTCFAEELMVDGTMYTFNNGGATIDAGETAITPPSTGCQTQTGWCNTNLNRSVWYTFVAPASGNVRVNCEGLTFDGQVAAYEVTDCNDFGTYTLVGANDDAPGGYNPPLMNLCGLTSGMTYYLMYDSYSTTATGTYNITVTDVVVEAGTDNGLSDICLGDTIDLFTNIAGNDAGGVWYENIPTANFNDPYFVSAGLASQVFGFDYVVTDGCAADTISTTVEIYAPSSAGVDGSITTCMNQPIDLLDALSGNVDLGGSWYDPSNSLMSSSAIAASAIPGQFNYDYITGNGVCPDDTANVIVTVDFNCDYLNLQEMYFDAMNIHPNPTTGMVYISNAGSNEVFNIELTDLKGKVIATQAGSINGTETSEVNLGNLETGIYMIRVYNDNAEKTFRIVKQ